MTILGQFIKLTDVLGNKYIGIEYDSDLLDFHLNLLREELNDSDAFEILRINQQNRDNFKFHTTVLSVSEYKKIKDGAELEKLLGSTMKLEVLGIGKAFDEKKKNTAYFVVLNSINSQAIRNMYGYNEKDFHITLGFDKKDVFNKSKGKDSLIIEL